MNPGTVSSKSPLRRNALIATSNPYIPQLMGGSERSSEAIAAHLARTGFDVSVICALEPRGWVGAWNRLRRKVLRIDFPSDKVGVASVFRCWAEDGSIARHITPFLNTVGTDIALVQAGYPFSIARELSRSAIPTIVFLRDVEFRDGDGDPVMQDHVWYIANSKFTAQRAKERFGIDIYSIVPPAVDPDHYRVGRRPRYALMVNPVQKKGVDIVLELARRRPDIPFVLLESWILSDASRRQLLAKIAGLDNVRFFGRQADIRPFYAEAKIVLIPSILEEAWGRVATEAQVSGIPVIASSIGGLPESVGPGGILISKGADIAEWENVLSATWDSPTALAALSDAASQHALRPEIQPHYLFSEIDRAISDLLRQ